MSIYAIVAEAKISHKAGRRQQYDSETAAMRKFRLVGLTRAAKQWVLGESCTHQVFSRAVVPGSLDFPNYETRRWNICAGSGSERFFRDRGLYQSGDTLAVVQEKNKDLRSLLHKLSWPRLTGFQAHGKSFQLPLRRKQQPLSEMFSPTAKLSYLTGFFDGDGCVAAQSNSSSCTLTVHQSFDQAEVLVLFRDTFGGSIVRGHDGVGLRKPILVWMLSGKLARRASRLLAPHSIYKKKQLLLASEWPDECGDRQVAAVELRSLKRYDSGVVGSCNMEYFAGFFDAEGHISLTRRTTLQLRVQQKHATVLHCLQGFLQNETVVSATVRHYQDSSVLAIYGTSACKYLLHQMLQVGLICKAHQAETAIRLTRENSACTRRALSTMVGNQGFGKRMDQAGVERALKILCAQTVSRKLLGRGEGMKAQAKLQEAADLRREHELLNAVRENQQLLEYVFWVRGLQGNFWQVSSTDMCSSR